MMFISVILFYTVMTTKWLISTLSLCFFAFYFEMVVSILIWSDFICLNVWGRVILEKLISPSTTPDVKLHYCFIC
jgi:hypothetical protein